MKKESPPTHLDVKAFAQAASSIAGRDLLSKYERLMQEAQALGADRVLEWSASGELRIDAAGAQQVWLHLTAALSLPLTCQRCLGPVDIPVMLNGSFRFVESEEVAAAQDEESEEDVLALSPEFNLAELIEDEVLMALPLIPCHETCPVELKLEAVDPDFEAASTQKRNPFAVLAQLKDDKLS
jgi:uncharacterized protein